MRARIVGIRGWYGGSSKTLTTPPCKGRWGVKKIGGNMPYARASRWLDGQLKKKLFRILLKLEDRRSLAYDAKHGVETAGEVALGDVGVAAQHVGRGNTVYRVTWGGLVQKSLAQLRIDHARYSFIDYGSGKGKALFMASDYPFKRIIGLEYARGLHAVASANCRNYRSAAQKCHALEPILADVLEYEPPAGPIVCFMCNPFDQATMRRVFDRWRARHDKGERDIRILYLNMRSIREMSAVLGQQDWLQPVAQGMRYVILAPRD